MRTAGDVVTKSEILDAVWDADYDGDDNVVEVYIGYLRRKIDQPFGRTAIETVRGVGYRLVAGRRMRRAPAGGHGVLRRFGGVRVRAAMAATIVVALILGLAAVTFVLLQRRQLEATLTDVAAQGAAAVAGQVARDGAGAADVIPTGGGERTLVQVIGSDGLVVRSSPAIVGEPPVRGPSATAGSDDHRSPGQPAHR